MRLAGKAAIVVGAGQTPGETIGNGRAAAILFAREGARVMAVDKDLDSARETVAMIGEEGGESFAVEADITREADCARLAEVSQRDRSPRPLHPTHRETVRRELHLP